MRKEEVMKRVREECATKCDMLLKNAEICSKFCRFVDHIERAHGDKLAEELEKIPKFEVLEWAMDDVVRLRIKQGLEDEHRVGDLFFEFVTKWLRYASTQKDEL